jgi:hemoglobin-like flavoprotein
LASSNREGNAVSSLTDTSNSSLLSSESLSVVQATAPVVAAHADQITAHFYPRMFTAHPELLRVFNQGNQATGEQSKALAGSVVAYAVQLIDPEASVTSSTPSSVSICSLQSLRFSATR